MSNGKETTISKPTIVPGNAKSPSDPANPSAAGCATSFLTLEKNEMNKVCGAVPPDPKEEYVQSDDEKESGGEA
jgi:hypothetical protein